MKILKVLLYFEELGFSKNASWRHEFCTLGLVSYSGM
jgi:hypothetical protein